MEKAAKVQVFGRVQGVGFRYFVYKNAQRVGVKGWVKNLHDGSVLAWFEGQETQVKSMIDLCKKGPMGSNVKDLKLDWAEPRGSYEDFDFRYE